jgi:copper/silver efflux system protein
MYDTAIVLKPRWQRRLGMTYEKLIAEMDSKLQFSALTNTWTMPIGTGSTWNSPGSRPR